MSSSTGPSSSSSSSASAATPSPASASSSTVVARDKKKRPWWIWAALAAVALLLLLLGLTQCGGDPSRNAPAAPATPAAGAAPSADPASAVNGAGAAAGAAADAAVGSLTADGTNLLPVAQVADGNGSLAGVVGKSVNGEGVTVQSVPADEGFWVGSSDTDRVWVQLDGADESGYKVKQGDKVSFTGTVKAHDPGFAPGIGVDAGEGADQLTKEAAHVAVPKGALKQFTG